MPDTAVNADVIDILSRFDEQSESGKTFLRQISQPPQRFHLTTLLVIIWAVVLMGIASMVSVRLVDPIAWLQHQPGTMMYSFQVPIIILMTAVLGKRFGTLAVALFLMAGFIGAPLFAGGGGWQYITSLTVGYLLGGIFVSSAMQPFLNKAYCNTGWFRGRSLWMAIGALVGVGLIHAMGAAGIGVHALRGALTWSEASAWLVQLSWPVLLYDFVFSWLAVALARFFRLMFWFCLY